VVRNHLPCSLRRQGAGLYRKAQPLLYSGGAAVKTYVCVDTFNLYFGCVKGTACKWLDIRRLCTLILPNHRIDRIKYFTARVGSRARDPDAPRRQEIYLRALRTIPSLEIFTGIS
jgi:hypothetical protein